MVLIPSVCDGFVPDASHVTPFCTAFTQSSLAFSYSCQSALWPRGVSSQSLKSVLALTQSPHQGEAVLACGLSFFVTDILSISYALHRIDKTWYQCCFARQNLNKETLRNRSLFVSFEIAVLLNFQFFVGLWYVPVRFSCLGDAWRFL